MTAVGSSVCLILDVSESPRGGALKHLVKEGTECGGAELCGSVGYALDGPIQVELAGDELAHGVERLDNAPLAVQPSLGEPPLVED